MWSNSLGCLQFTLDKGTIISRRWYLALRKADQAPMGNPASVTKWLKDFTGGHLTKVMELTRCCFCWRSVVLDNGQGRHIASQCSWLLTFNKERNNAGLAPIAVLEGSLRLTPAKKDISVEGLAKDFSKEKKEVRGELGKLDKRVTALEPKGKKRKADQLGASATTGQASTTTEQPLTKKQKAAAKRKAKKEKKAAGKAAAAVGAPAATASK